MAKEITPLTIDAELKRQAKERGFNMSEIAQNAIREKLGNIDITIEENKACAYCGREMGKAFVDIKGIEHKGLRWLFPDERWICPKCLFEKSKRAVIC
jgi:post-segregation antitoxin (ccd killing protein)